MLSPAGTARRATEDELADPWAEPAGTYQCALEYRHRRGVLQDDCELTAAVERIGDEQARRIQIDDAISAAEDAARSAVKRAQARRDLGL